MLDFWCVNSGESRWRLPLPKGGEFVRGHDKPRLMGVANQPSILSRLYNTFSLGGWVGCDLEMWEFTLIYASSQNAVFHVYLFLFEISIKRFHPESCQDFKRSKFGNFSGRAKPKCWNSGRSEHAILQWNDNAARLRCFNDVTGIR